MRSLRSSSAFESIPPQIAAQLKDMGEDGASLVKILPALGGLAAKLGGGRLKRLAPQILAGTQVVFENDKGEKERAELGKSEDRSTLFESRPDLYFPCLWYAGKVTFGRFFPALGKRKGKAPPTATASS